MKLKALLSKIKYEAVIFAVLSAQILIRIDWAHPVSTNFLSFYLLDYKVGFISRAFIGSVLAIFTQKVTEKWLTGFILLTLVFVYFILALMLGKLMRNSTGDMKSITIFLVALFLFTSFTVRTFIQNIGMLDIYWFLFALLSMICLRNKFTKWFIPFLCFFGCATHYSFAFSFFPFIFVLLLYSIYNEKSKLGSVFIAAGSSLVAVFSSVYFVFFSNRHLKFDSDGVFQYLSHKSTFPVWRYFFDGYLFYTDINSGEKVNGFSGFIGILKKTAAEGLHYSNFAAGFLLMLPLLVCFFFIWKNAFKLSQNKGEKFILLLCMALPLPVLPSFVISTDLPRFLGEILIVQFLMLFYLVFDKNSSVLESLKRAEMFFKKYPILLILLFIFSLSAVFSK